VDAREKTIVFEKLHQPGEVDTKIAADLRIVSKKQPRRPRAAPTGLK
jgi:hypothetical protein